MATGGDNYSGSVESEDFDDVVCDPCQENGELHNAVGMCIDCQDYLCQRCFDVHKISRTSRRHELLDKEAMLQSQRSQVSRIKDTCIEKCAVHEKEVIKYYCINHSHLGCSVCITLDHRTCESVRYIPHVAKDLASNEEYQQVESHLNSVVERSKTVTEDSKQKTESLKKDSSEAVKMVQDYRKQMNKALDKIENDLIKHCESLRSEETEKLSSIAVKFQKALAELNTLIVRKDTYQNNKQNCNLYTFMMKTKDELKLAENWIKEAEKEQSHINSHIKFVANKETLNTLKLPETFGKLLTSRTSSTVRSEQTQPPGRQKEQTNSMISGTPTYVTQEQTQPPVRQKEHNTSMISGTPTYVRQEQTQTVVRQKKQNTSMISGTPTYVRQEQTQPVVGKKEQTTSVKKVEAKIIVRAEKIQDINVKSKNETKNCNVTGLAVLPNNRLVLADWNNGNVKLVDIKHDQVISYLALSSNPGNVAMVTNSQVAVTLTNDKKVAMVNVTATTMTVDRTLDMDGKCQRVDYRDGKLAVSFLSPNKVQVLTLQGRVLYTITTDQQGQYLFYCPQYIAFGQDNTSLYVSNCGSNHVVNVKFNGTVVGTYTDSELRFPYGLLTDSSGHVYVCGHVSNNIHQMTPDCRKVQVLLNKVDGLHWPQCISYSESDCRLYVGMGHSNVVKVYGVILDSK